LRIAFDLRFFCTILLFFAFTPVGSAQDSALEEGAEELLLEDGDLELDTADIEALRQLREERRRKNRLRRRNALIRKDYSRELMAVVALLVLLLLSRKHNREQEKHRPVRVSPLSPDELGRAIFGHLRSGDSLAYRALYLTGGEARDLFGEAGVDVYLENRTGPKLQEAFKRLVGQVPVGAQYQGCVIQEEVCVVQVLASDGKEHVLTVGRVALVGAVIRLVSPASD